MKRVALGVFFILCTCTLAFAQGGATGAISTTAIS
jgi:hypothetical protein